MMKVEIVRLYFKDIYTGWQTKKPDTATFDYAYFFKIDGKYFWIGDQDSAYHVTENG